MEKQGKDIKDVIVKTTKILLMEKGNATIKEIADKAYVNVAAINYHFGSKNNLIEIVIKEVISDLRNEILASIDNFNIVDYNFEETIMYMFEIIFTFAKKNAGIINYSFLQLANQSKAANILVELFITDKDFINTITKQLALVLPDASNDVLFSKYIILFSAFVVPFFLSFSGWYPFFNNKNQTTTTFLDKYRKSYLQELKNIVFC